MFSEKCCSLCENLVEIGEWDSDDVEDYECSVTGNKVKPEFVCDKFKYLNGEQLPTNTNQK